MDGYAWDTLNRKLGNAGLEILLGIEVRWIYYLMIIEILMNNLSLLFYFKFARSGIIRGEKF